MSERKKRNIIIGALCTVLLLMVVGYAAFQSVLKIKGTSTISSNWDIKITSITSEVLHGSATNAKDPEGIGTLTASFETNLVSPGDSMKYTITVANQGNINAKLDKITISEPDNEYISFETSGLTEGEPLNAGSTADLKVTVTFKDVEINKMDTSTSKLTVQLDYSQADGNNGTVGGQTAANQLIATEVTTGDGLYADEYEAGRYVYKGANPNNYITFNNETWRILAVESDGTLKIMKKDSIGKIVWDTSNSNNWVRPATLNTYLNNDYYNSLGSETQDLIYKDHSWGIGSAIFDNTDLAEQIESENSRTWTGNIGLMSASDAIKANTNTEQCGNMGLRNSNTNICKSENYIVPSSGEVWTITTNQAENRVFTVPEDGRIGHYFTTWQHYGVLPTLYLTPNITLEGKGTESNPYTIN